MGIYDNVVTLIESQNLTINKVETKAGIANGTIAGWKNGSQPYVETLHRVAKVLGCSIDDLIKED